MKRQSKSRTPKNILLIICIVLISVSCGQSDKKSETKKTETPELDLMTAIIMNDYKTVLLHIEAGTDLNEIEQMGGSTPLITSVTFGRSEISKELINAGADLTIENFEGATALFVAALFCRTETLKLLLESGADPTTSNMYGSTALGSLEAPFEAMRPIYEEISKGLGPLGFKLDYDRLEQERPIVAEILRSNIEK